MMNFTEDQIIKKGEIPLNSVINADCLNVMKFIKDGSVDMILCDLPYGTTRCKWDTIIDLDKLWIEYKRIIKPNGPIILFAQTPFDKVLGHLMSKKRPMKAHENILIFYKKQPLYNPQKTDGHKRKVSTAHHKRNTSTGDIYGKSDNFSDYDSTERYPRSVLTFPSDKQTSNLHSTQKPLALCEYLIKTYSKENDLILDNTAGSGTTGLASKNLKRNYIMIEKDEEIFKVCCDRII